MPLMKLSPLTARDVTGVENERSTSCVGMGGKMSEVDFSFLDAPEGEYDCACKKCRCEEKVEVKGEVCVLCFMGSHNKDAKEKDAK